VVGILVLFLAVQIGVPDSLVYTVSPQSRFEVQVGRSGMLSVLGHDHLIRARAFSGRVVYRPSAPARSHLAIVVRADSLEVLTPPDTAEIRKVTEVMRGQVLRVDRSPEIRFLSREVTPAPHGFRVRGDLTIAGVTREVTADVATTGGAGAGGDTLRAEGRLEVKQTDFGITPVRAGGGTVRVADRVVITFAVVAVRDRAR
jgi:polyisoprenoid-binding protein YceI